MQPLKRKGSQFALLGKQIEIGSTIEIVSRAIDENLRCWTAGCSDQLWAAGRRRRDRSFCGLRGHHQAYRCSSSGRRILGCYGPGASRVVFSDVAGLVGAEPALHPGPIPIPSPSHVRCLDQPHCPRRRSGPEPLDLRRLAAGAAVHLARPRPEGRKHDAPSLWRHLSHLCRSNRAIPATMA